MSNSIPLAGKRFSITQIQRFRKHPLEQISYFSKSKGPIFRINLGIHKPIVILEPNVISRIFLNHHNYPKSTLYKDIKIVLGEGLVTSIGEKWENQRKKIQPVFRKNIIDGYQDIILNNSRTLIQKIKNKKTIDLESWMKKISLNIILDILFGEKEKSKYDFDNAINTIIEFSKLRTAMIFKLPLFFPNRSNRLFWSAKKTFSVAVKNLMDSSTYKLSDTMFSILNDFHKNDENQLEDELSTLIMAGHETVAHGLVWILCMLSDHPNVNEKLRKQILEKPDDSTYLNHVINETLRLMPPVPILTRNVIKREKVNEWTLPSRSLLFIPIYNFHRNEKFWDKAEEFIPERWSAPPPNIKNIFVPFASGSRKCIGDRLAFLELKIIIDELVKNFDIKKISCENIKTNPFVTLRPTNKIIVKTNYLKE